MRHVTCINNREGAIHASSASLFASTFACLRPPASCLLPRVAVVGARFGARTAASVAPSRLFSFAAGPCPPFQSTGYHRPHQTPRQLQGQTARVVAA